MGKGIYGKIHNYEHFACPQSEPVTSSPLSLSLLLLGNRNPYEEKKVIYFTGTCSVSHIPASAKKKE